MNEGLQERFGRGRNAYHPEENSEDGRRPTPTLNLNIRAYFDDSKVKGDGGPWLGRPEFPSAEEILDTEVLGLVPNKPKGPWESNGEHIPTLLPIAANADHKLQRLV